MSNIMIKLLSITFLLCMLTNIQAQDTSEGVRVVEWNDFQATQEQMVERQSTILGRLGKMDQRVRQINLNLLSWQTATQNAAAGDNRGCDLFKTKYDPRIEWTVVSLAILGVYLALSRFLGLFKRQVPTVKEAT